MSRKKGKRGQIYGYTRRSKPKGEPFRELSREQQERRIRERAKILEKEGTGTWAQCYWEPESAVKVPWTKRPVYQELLGRLHRGDILIVWRLSRIDRSPFLMVDALRHLTDRGIRLIALELEFGEGGAKYEIDLDTSWGRAMVMLMGMVNEMWLGQLRESTSAALQEIRRQGYVFGPRGVPIGKHPIKCPLPNGEVTWRGKNPFRYKMVWHQGDCNIMRETWIRHRVFQEPLASIALDFARRDLRMFDGKPWVRIVTEKPEVERGKPVYRPNPKLDFRKLRTAVKRLDEMYREHNAPPELALNEEVIRHVAAQLAERDGSEVVNPHPFAHQPRYMVWPADGKPRIEAISEDK